MTVRFDRPIATADRAQNLTDTKDTLVAVAKQLDDTTPTGVATGMLRWSSTNGKWQKYNGTSWADLAATYNINVSHLGGQAAANYLLSATAASTYLAKAGGTLTGFLTLHAAPTADLHAATKKYADDKVAALPVLASGAYTPTLTAGSNVSTFTLHAATYMRCGNVVSVAVRASIEASAGSGTLTQLHISLPVASNFTTAYHLVGSDAYQISTTYGVGVVYADPTNDRATLQFASPASGSSVQHYIAFQYQVL